MNTFFRKGISVIKRNEGLTLVEVMMTLLIFATVLTVVNSVFFTTQGLYTRTQQRAEMQMSTRAGLNLMATEIRALGCDPTEAGIAGLRTARADSCRFQSDTNGDGVIQVNEPSEDIVYYYDADAEIVYRDPGTGPQEFITNVSGFAFQYFDVDNVQMGPLPLASNAISDVRSIGIVITAESRRSGEINTSTRIGLRNVN